MSLGLLACLLHRPINFCLGKSAKKYKYMSAIGKKKAKPRTQLYAEEKPLFSTEWKPVLMFTKTELCDSAAQIKGLLGTAPQRTEEIWRMMPFSSAFHATDDWQVEYILMKLVELRGLHWKHFYMEEHKHNQALADVHLAAMLAQSQAMLAQSQARANRANRANRASRSLNPP